MIARRALAATAIATLAAIAASCNGRDCGKIEDDASALVAENETCGAGDTCEVVDLYAAVGTSNSCLGAFQCSTAFRKGWDRTAFATRAQELIDEHRNCTTCVQAGCAPPGSFTASCDAGAGRCVLAVSH